MRQLLYYFSNLLMHTFFKRVDMIQKKKYIVFGLICLHLLSFCLPHRLKQCYLLIVLKHKCICNLTPYIKYSAVLFLRLQCFPSSIMYTQPSLGTANLIGHFSTSHPFFHYILVIIISKR